MTLDLKNAIIYDKYVWASILWTNEMFCERCCRLEITNDGRTTWIIQRNKKRSFLKNERKNKSNELEKKLSFLYVQKITKNYVFFLLNERLFQRNC